jgi:hypothetical protein
MWKPDKVSAMEKGKEVLHLTTGYDLTVCKGRRLKDFVPFDHAQLCLLMPESAAKITKLRTSLSRYKLPDLCGVDCKDLDIV